jgi:hypothetical protein
VTLEIQEPMNVRQLGVEVTGQVLIGSAGEYVECYG